MVSFCCYSGGCCCVWSASCIDGCFEFYDYLFGFFNVLLLMVVNLPYNRSSIAS